MGFSISAGLAGAAKRGMQFNDEQRKLLNDNIQAAVSIGVTDAMEQRKARKQLETSYTNTATKLKSYKLSDAQIEAVYAKYGNSAPEQIAAALADASAQHALKNKKNGVTDNPWTVANEQEWLQSRFTLPEGVTSDMVQGRSTAEQARAYTDVNMPLTMVDPTQMAKSLAAGSGEISIRGSAAREQAIANQMSGMLSASTGGMQESGPATFGNQYGFSLGPTSKEVNEAAMAETQLAQAEANLDLTGVQIDGLGLDQISKIQDIEQAKKQNPLLIKQLEAAIANSEENTRGLSLANAITEATKGETIASKLLDTVIKEIQAEAGQLANAQARLNLAQDPVLFAKQLEELDVRIEGIGYDNYKKKIENQDLAFMAELSKELKIIEVEQAGLRGDLVREQIIAARAANGLRPLEKELLEAQVQAAKNKNSLFGLEQDQLEATLANLEARTEQTIAQTAEIGKDKTYQAALVEVTQAIAELEANQNNMPADVFNQKMIALTGTQSRLNTGLISYTQATDKSDGSTVKPISYTALVNGYNKGLAAKLSAAGIVQGVGGRNFQITDNGTVIFDRGKIGVEGGKIIDQHNAEYSKMLDGQTWGDQAKATLFGDQQAAPASSQIPVITIENGEATVPAGVSVGDRVQSADGEVRIYNGPDADPMFSPVE